MNLFINNNNKIQLRENRDEKTRRRQKNWTIFLRYKKCWIRSLWERFYVCFEVLIVLLLLSPPPPCIILYNHYRYCKCLMPFLHILVSILNVIDANFLSFFSPIYAIESIILCYSIPNVIQYVFYFNISLVVNAQHWKPSGKSISSCENENTDKHKMPLFIFIHYTYMNVLKMWIMDTHTDRNISDMIFLLHYFS